MHLTNSLFLSQVVHQHTRLDQTLDLCFTNDPQAILQITSMEVEDQVSDHNIINISTAYSMPSISNSAPPESVPEFSTFDFPSADLDSLGKKLEEIKWLDIINHNTMSPGDILDIITAQTTATAKAVHVPQRHHVSNSTRNTPKHRHALMKKRCAFLHRLALHPQQKSSLQPRIDSINQKLRESLAQQNIAEEKKAIEAISKDPAAFFKYANSKRKTKKSAIGPLKTSFNGQPHYEYGPAKMAQILSDQFESVFSTPDPSKKVNDPRLFFSQGLPTNIKSLSDIKFNVPDVELVLGDLKPTSGDGPDGWSAYFLHHFRKIMALPIFLLWRRSLDTGIMPEGINLAFITPIFKGGEKFVPVNYRPISLTSHLTKTFERIVRKSIVAHLAEENLLNKTQHGFVANRSTMTQLIEYYARILDYLENKGQVDAVYLDFAKAFDKCDHGVILQKLKAYGIGGKVGIWIHNFLTQRQQQVRIQGHTSKRVWVTSGVPQGSVLGPLLFSILLSDINEGVFTASILSYADDTKIFHAIDPYNDSEALQNDLDKLGV